MCIHKLNIISFDQLDLALVKTCAKMDRIAVPISLFFDDVYFGGNSCKTKLLEISKSGRNI